MCFRDYVPACYVLTVECTLLNAPVRTNTNTTHPVARPDTTAVRWEGRRGTANMGGVGGWA
eukprot:42622-Eustigmatos_ZCMA.PRE.1